MDKIIDHQLEQEENQQNNQNTINWEQILNIIPKEANQENQKKRKILFQKLDKRKTGFLTLKDMTKIKKYLKFDSCILADDSIQTTFNSVIENNPSTKVVGNIDKLGIRHFFYGLHQYFDYYIQLFGENSFSKTQVVNNQNYQQLKSHLQSKGIDISLEENTLESIIKAQKSEQTSQNDILYNEWAKIIISKSYQYIPEFEEKWNEDEGIINEEEEEYYEFSNDSDNEGNNDNNKSDQNLENLDESERVFEKQKKQNIVFYNNYNEYLEKTGISKAFEIIFNEIIAQNIDEQQIYKYTSQRLREIGKQLEPFMDNGNYKEFIRPENNFNKNVHKSGVNTNRA